MCVFSSMLHAYVCDGQAMAKGTKREEHKEKGTDRQTDGEKERVIRGDKE